MPSMTHGFATESDLLNGVKIRNETHSGGYSLASEMDAEIEAENLAENTVKADTEYKTSGLQSLGVARDDYDFPAIAGKGQSIANGEAGVRLDNKFLAPQKLEVAGKDLSTGQRYRSPLVDSEGYAKQGFDLLQDSYKDSAGGRPAEDSYPLGYIGYQVMTEGKGYEDFVKMIPDDWPEQNKKAAWATANRVQDRINMEEYVSNNEPPESQPSDLPPIKVDALPLNSKWMNAVTVLATKMDNISKYQNPEQLNDFGLNMLSTFNWNVTAMAAMASRVMSSEDDELKQAFYDAMMIYESIDVDLVSEEGVEFFGRAVRGVGTDPFAWVTAGLATAVYRGTMETIGRRMGSKYFAPVLSRGLSGASAGATEEGAREAATGSVKQGVAISAGEQEGFDIGKAAGDTAKATAVGAVGGAAIDLGIMGAGNVGSKVYSRMKEIAGDPNFFDTSHLRERGAVGDLQKSIARALGEPEEVKPFYSKMQETIAAKLQPKGTGKAYAQTISSWAKKGQDFKAEEYKWSGLDDYLKENADTKLTRQDIDDWLEENNVKIEVKRLGLGDEAEANMVSVADTNKSPVDDPDYVDSTAEDILDDLKNDPDSYYRREKRTNESDEDAAQRIAQEQYDDNPYYEAKEEMYGYSWQGNDDVGWVVRDPEGVAIGDVVYDEPRIQELITNDQYEAGRMEYGSENVPEGFEGPTEFHDYRVEGGENYRETTFTWKPPYGEFTAGHYQDSNVLVHSRISDFVTDDGNSTMFLDEVQSDWHKMGEEKGYSTQEARDKATALDDEYSANAKKITKVQDQQSDRFDEIRKINAEQQALGNFNVPNYTQEAADKWGDLQDLVDVSEGQIKRLRAEGDEIWERSKIADRVVDRGMPDAPLKKGKSIELAMRSSLREASLEGKDSLSWSSASVHEDRWGGEHGGVFKNQYDKAMVKYANKLGKKFGSSVRKAEIVDDSGNIVEIWELPITDQMRESAKTKGVELFQFGAGVGAAGIAADQIQGDEDGGQFK